MPNTVLPFDHASSLLVMKGGHTTKVSNSDLEMLSRYTWGVTKSPGGLYARARDVTRSGNYQIKLHRLVTGVTDPKAHVDHINGDKLDNRRENLRVCSAQENQANSAKHKIGRTRFKGVAGFRHSKVFRAYINKDRRQIHLGTFPTAEEAARAYDRAAIQLFGEFALTNAKMGAY